MFAHDSVRYITLDLIHSVTETSLFSGTTDDSGLPSSTGVNPGTGRRQTLPELIAKLDIESGSGNVAGKPAAGFAVPIAGGKGNKKPLVDFTSQRKASVPDATPNVSQCLEYSFTL